MVIQKCEKSERWIFCKNCLTLVVSGSEKKNTHFRAHYLFWPIFSWTKTVQSRNHYKNRGFSGNCKKSKNDTFFWKRVFFLTWLKKWVLLTVFLKSCVFLKTLFYSVSAKHSFSKTKTVCWKKRKFMKNSGLFLNMAKRFFLGGFVFLRF